MKKSILLTFVLAAGFVATFLTGCGDGGSTVYNSTNYVGTFHGYFTLESLAFSNPALDTVIGKQLLDTLTISENGNTEDNIVTATSKVLNTSLDVTLTSETTGSIAINNKSITIETTTATNVNASGSTTYNPTTKALTISATATSGTVFSLPVLGIAKPKLGGYFTKQP